MDAVVIKDFYWKYPNFTGIRNDYVLKGINLTIREGEFLGITGRSGSGKTTLCFSIAGLVPHQLRIPDHVEEHMSGSVEVFGELVSGVKKAANGYELDGVGSMAPTVGFVMQDPESQFLSMSMLHEVSLGLQMMGLDKVEINKRITEALDMVGLGQYRDVAGRIHPAELSGGQKQRLIIASFLAMRPKLLILDEPTSDLDPAGKLEVMKTIADLRKKSNMTIILVEHNPDVMLKFADRIAVMYGGKIVQIGKPLELYSKPDILREYNVYLPDVSELSDYFSLDETPKFQLEKSSFVPERKTRARTDRIIDVRGVSFSYPDGTKALDGITLEVEKGEMIAIVGQNGSGKSTLSKVLSGIAAPSGGAVNIAGLSANSRSERRKLPLHVGYVFQNPDHQIFTRTVKDELYYGLKNIGVKRADAEESINSVLARVGLSDKANEDPIFLGRGQKRRLAVASSIIMKPEILIVDEPTTGQDYKMSRDIMDLLTELNLQGTTILIITHDMRLVAEYCRRVVVMSKGTLVFDGTPEKLFMEDDILAVASLSEPQSVRMSKELVRQGFLRKPLISAREWLQFFNFMRLKSGFEFSTYSEMDIMSRSLIDTIIEKRGKPAALVYIERGGMVPAFLILSKFPDIKTYRIRASYYSDVGTASKDVEIYNIPNDLSRLKSGYILLIDEIVDTGKTMLRIRDELKPRVSVDIVTASIFLKKQSAYTPDFYSKLVESDVWIVLPYEKNETIHSVGIKRPEELRHVTGMFDGDTSDYGKIDEYSRRVAEKIREMSWEPKIIVYKLPESMLFARILSDALRVNNVAGISTAQEVGELDLGDTEGVILLVALQMTGEMEAIKDELSSYGKVELITPGFETADAYRTG
ncbi:MAG: hypothetical protein B2I17_00660 [Thermoplasmatales archaeon B_DKE]|nr:MAG: hypothetical protein B2I17_00660 [Thermoplasmatales archaeon B_DKE]QRF75628.1 Trehalose/maltose import ATP-binding protein MalK [Thermoplasmatales archaeon]